jgi:superfamily II DNA/RNA helicase
MVSITRKLFVMSDNLFSRLGTPEPIVSALTRLGIDTPFPIQVDTLPDTLAGRDVLGRGKTGSGKTLAFSIPMVARLAQAVSANRRTQGQPLGLVLAPTRELASQITAVIAPLAQAMNLRVTTIFGGVSQNKQVRDLRDGVEIVVATPGRVEDLMAQGHLRLDSIQVTVLDEADHMADLGFLPGVTRILNATPQRGQRLLFSATLDNGVNKLVDRFLTNPVTHAVDDATSAVVQMTHHVFETPDATAKKDLVFKLASGQGRRILFMRTKHHTKKLARALTEAGIPAVDLHGNLSQPARDRNLKAFSDGVVNVLVATDVAARGVHVDNVDLVIHVDPPTEHKAYLHRSGRTARAGASGDVITLSLPTERKDLADLLRKAAITVRPVRVTSTSPEVMSLVGEIAPYVKPVPAQPTHQVVKNLGGGQSQGRNARRKRALKTRNAPSAGERGGQPGQQRRASQTGHTSGSRRSRPSGVK